MDQAYGPLFCTPPTLVDKLICVGVLALPFGIISWSLTGGRTETWDNWVALGLYLVLQLGLTLTLAQLLAGIPWRLAMRLQRAPLLQVSPSELNRRLDLACQTYTLARNAPSESFHVEVAFHGTLPGKAIKLRLRCYNGYAPDHVMLDAYPALQALLVSIIFAGDDPRVFTRYATFHHPLLRWLPNIRPLAEDYDLENAFICSNQSTLLHMTQHQRLKILSTLRAAGVPTL